MYTQWFLKGQTWNQALIELFSICSSQLCSQCLWVTDCGQQTVVRLTDLHHIAPPPLPLQCMLLMHCQDRNPSKLQTGITNQTSIIPINCHNCHNSYRSRHTYEHLQTHKHKLLITAEDLEVETTCFSIVAMWIQLVKIPHNNLFHVEALHLYVHTLEQVF